MLSIGDAKNYNWASSSSSILSEFGTMHLEFLYLSYITGKPIYKEKVVAIRNFLDKIEKKDGLYYNYLNPQSGRWGQGRCHHIECDLHCESFQTTMQINLSSFCPIIRFKR